eukprot:15439717-Alexandrium_andersonii.AAC.1
MRASAAELTFCKIGEYCSSNIGNAKLLQAFEPGTARAQERAQSCFQKLPRARSAQLFAQIPTPEGA